MTMWFNRTPGSPVAESIEEEGTLLLGENAPDWVRSPPELGSEKLRVRSIGRGQCPKCRKADEVRIFVLEKDFYVAECTTPACGFVWFKI